MNFFGKDKKIINLLTIHSVYIFFHVGMLYHEKCNCPVSKIDKWFDIMSCPESYHQIDEDLAIFHDVDLDKVAEEAITRFSNRGMHSLSHYRIIENKVRNYAT
jgi:hypothetical protein